MAAGKCWGEWRTLSAIWVNGLRRRPQTEAVSLLSASFHTIPLWFAVLTVGVIEKHRLGWAAFGSRRMDFGLDLRTAGCKF